MDTPQLPAITGEFVRRIDLPSGGWVVYRDPTDLRGKHKERVMRNIKTLDSPGGFRVDMVTGTICMLIEAWGDIPYLPDAPLPCDEPGILGELKLADYDALYAAAEPAVDLLFPSRAKPEDADTPGSPTGPASD